MTVVVEVEKPNVGTTVEVDPNEGVLVEVDAPSDVIIEADVPQAQVETVLWAGYEPAVGYGEGPYGAGPYGG